jgi:hypothetical protein
MRTKLKNGLDKERNSGRRWAVILLAVVALIAVLSLCVPGIAGFCHWMNHRKGSYLSRAIDLPVMWRQETKDSWQRMWPTELSESRARLSATAFDADAHPPDFWHEEMVVRDRGLLPAIQVLLDAGMSCRSMSAEGSDPVELWCFSSDRRKLFMYEGSRSYLSGAVSIIRQAN